MGSPSLVWRVCPKCGAKFIVSLWKPRPYCPPCRDWIAKQEPLTLREKRKKWGY